VTLILSLLTPNWVMQVSDRRLTRRQPSSGEIESYDDDANKAVLWCGRLAFAYTGLGDLGDNERTDLWLAETLTSIHEEAPEHKNPSPDQAHLLTELAKRCSWEFDRPSISHLDAQHRSHAFVAVGWARFDGAAEFEPYLACISNVYSADSFTPLATPAREFVFWHRRLAPDDGGYFLAEGQLFDEREQAAMLQQLGALDHAFPGEPEPLLEALIDKVREKAEENDLIGKGLLANVLPRASIIAGSDEHTVLLGAPIVDQQTFLYLPPGQGQPGVWHGPVTCCTGLIVSDFEVRELT
jgi:hypothetical protein